MVRECGASQEGTERPTRRGTRSALTGPSAGQDREVPVEILHGHDVLRRPQLRWRRRLRRPAVAGAAAGAGTRSTSSTAPTPSRRSAAATRSALMSRRRACTSTAWRAGSASSRRSPPRSRAGPSSRRRRSPSRSRRSIPTSSTSITSRSSAGRASWAWGESAVRLMTAHEHWLICPMHLLWKYDRKACDSARVRPLLAGGEATAAALAVLRGDRARAGRARRPDLPEPARPGGAPAPRDRRADGPPALFPPRRLVGRGSRTSRLTADGGRTWRRRGGWCG